MLSELRIIAKNFLGTCLIAIPVPLAIVYSVVGFAGFLAATEQCPGGNDCEDATGAMRIAITVILLCALSVFAGIRLVTAKPLRPMILFGLAGVFAFVFLGYENYSRVLARCPYGSDCGSARMLLGISGAAALLSVLSIIAGFRQVLSEWGKSSER